MRHIAIYQYLIFVMVRADILFILLELTNLGEKIKNISMITRIQRYCTVCIGQASYPRDTCKISCPCGDVMCEGYSNIVVMIAPT